APLRYSDAASKQFNGACECCRLRPTIELAHPSTSMPRCTITTHIEVVQRRRRVLRGDIQRLGEPSKCSVGSSEHSETVNFSSWTVSPAPPDPASPPRPTAEPRPGHAAPRRGWLGF